MQIATTAVNPATAAANKSKDCDDDDSDSTQVHEPQDEEAVYQEPAKETTKGAVEPAKGFKCYVLIDEDKGRFHNMVTCLASRAAAHLITLAI